MVTAPYASLKELPNCGAPVFVLSVPEVPKCVISSDLTGPAAAPREGQRRPCRSSRWPSRPWHRAAERPARRTPPPRGPRRGCAAQARVRRADGAIADGHHVRTTPAAPQDPAPFAPETGIVLHPTATRVVYARPGGPPWRRCLPPKSGARPGSRSCSRSRAGTGCCCRPGRTGPRAGSTSGGGGLQTAYSCLPGGDQPRHLPADHP